ncbi:unnamed protein product [Mycena citricolor]|uniref:Uncharacterized protein n=1 Tax=Mycena citricolor TaxID=2018698 RepID=A0AAD2HMZ8_9AGAR|nr:unnamed protein product [Mycena citricolor]
MAEPWSPKRSLAEVNALLTAPGTPLEVEERLVDGRILRVYKNQWPSLRAFWLWAATTYSDRVYLVFEDQRYTYKAALAKSLTAAAVFRDVYGIRKGDRVGICSRNYPDYMIAFYACQLLGAVAVLTNAWLPTVPLIHCLTHTSCKLIVLDCERAKRLQPSTGKLGGASLLVLNSHEDKGRRWKGMRCWDEVMAAYDKDTSEILKPDFVDIHPEDNATIMFTSGTTGLPKGVLSTQRQFGTNILNAIVARRRAALRRGEEIPVPAPGSPQPGLLISVPLFHVTGLTSHMMMATFGGAKAVLIRKWVPEEAARVIIEEKLTSAGGVPSMPGDLLETILAKQHYPIEGLSLGGAPAPESLPARARKAFPSVTLSQGYGMTECNAIATSFAGEDYLARPTSCGLPPPVNEISIVAKGRAVPAGEVGEVWIRGPNVMKEYWRDTKATSKVLTKDGWLRTGDLGLLDQEGFLYIKDRIKDIIIRGGENIDSTSVENALFTEGVQEAAAVAVPDIKLGELVAAVVSVSPEFREKITEAGLIALARERLPKFAVPVMVLFLDVLPHNASGKVVKADLRALAGKEWERRRKFAAKL